MTKFGGYTSRAHGHQCWKLLGMGWSLGQFQMADVAGAKLSYDDAVARLHTSLVSSSDEAKTRNPAQKVYVMRSFLQRLGLRDDPKDLKIIHVSGTKGKGSTCAFCESILRHHGYKTGMFTSPHMNEVRERIRINGKPITKDMFAHCFSEVYAKLKQTTTENTLNQIGGLPAYFNFTVLMSLYMFVREKVDIAIYEVGLGGENDGTNFFVQPAVCGVTSLGYDHLSSLGDTLDQIAWHKAGIFKKGCPVITVPQQAHLPRRQFRRLGQTRTVSLLQKIWNFLWKILWPFPTLKAWLYSAWKFFFTKHPMQVILIRAVERQCPIFVALPLSEEIQQHVELGISGKCQFQNAALAVQMCKIIRNKDTDSSHRVATKSLTIKTIPRLVTSVDDLDQATLEGLKTCYWPGRTEIIRHESITYYLDGAHTEESIEHCAEWFREEADREMAALERENRGKVMRFLVFNVTKNRNPGNLLRHLSGCGFAKAVFTPHLKSTLMSERMIDHFDVHLTQRKSREIPQENSQTWNFLVGADHSSLTFPCILQALAWVTQDRDPLVKVADPLAVLPDIPQQYREATHIQVLVTGSLLLVGPVLGILKPDMND
ncbi:folylpolyglutamate synthase [Plakobranchus ocellatus]|uniref:tetrahydrofolate synthase n=1 Tax=Plakobranchus ocellatus TaxID=259542 RepID=A0AAV4CI12_9GAST|nr:folylpolyglutamate synthase [Plakobranchus ocellatus]